MDIVASQPTMQAAIRLCANVSGLEPKQIAPRLGFKDQGHYSCCMSGEKHLDPNKLDLLMEVCGNEAPLMWLANKRGYTLVLLKSEAEKRAEEAERALHLEREKNRVLMEAIQGRRA